jgi:hypothetical protein
MKIRSERLTKRLAAPAERSCSGANMVGGAFCLLRSERWIHLIPSRAEGVKRLKLVVNTVLVAPCYFQYKAPIATLFFALTG